MLKSNFDISNGRYLDVGQFSSIATDKSDSENDFVPLARIRSAVRLQFVLTPS